jgi:polyisoprenoid-binding protein YceI
MVTTFGMAAIGAGLAAGRWTLDHHHSAVSFSIRHLGLSRVRGRFERFDATLELGDTVADTKITATIDMASISTGQPDRDTHLRSTDFFRVDQHPEMRFVSTAISGSGEDWQLTGDLTLNGHTAPLTLAVEFNGVEVFAPDGKRHAGFSATGSLRRSLYGIEFGLLPIGGDKLALGDEVKIELEIQFIEPGETA